MKKFCFLLLLAFGCQNDEADTPELNTEEAQQIGSTSVVMGGEVIQVGPVRPVNIGFLWATQPDLTVISGVRIVVASTSEPRKFSIKQEYLIPSTQYYYRAFAANVDYSKIYYSNVRTFNTLP